MQRPSLHIESGATEARATKQPESFLEPEDLGVTFPPYR